MGLLKGSWVGQSAGPMGQRNQSEAVHQRTLRMDVALIPRDVRAPRGQPGGLLETHSGTMPALWAKMETGKRQNLVVGGGGHSGTLEGS